MTEPSQSLLALNSNHITHAPEEEAPQREAGLPPMLLAAAAAMGPGVMQRKLQRRALQRWAAQGESRDGPPQGALADGGGSPLPGPVLGKMERSFGADLSAVRVHQGPSAEAMGAVAYAQGADIHFAQGHYAPDSPSGQELIGHEVAHVVQQSQGRVSATAQAKGVEVNDDPALEAEADQMGARAARGEAAGGDAAPPQRTEVRPGRPLRQGYHMVASKVYGNHDFDTQDAVGGSFLKPDGTPNIMTSHRAPLRVSQNYEMAIEDADLAARQAKAFYARDPALIEECNRKLRISMSRFQLVIDTGDSFRLRSPGGKLTMHRVVPRNVENGTQGYMGPNRMTLKQKCNENVNQVTGGSPMPVAKGQTTARAANAGGRDYDAVHRVLTGRDEDATIDYTTMASAQGTIRSMVKEYGKKLHASDPGMAQNLEDFELNEHAPAPEIGEAMFSTSLDAFHASGDTKDYANNRTIPAANKNQLWGQHWGGVVANDSGDYITLENYARNTEDAGGDTELDPRYYFQMYGTAVGQTWHEQWAAIGHGGREFSNPLSMLAKSTRSIGDWEIAADGHFGGQYATIRDQHALVTGAPDDEALTEALLKAMAVARAPLNGLSMAEKKERARILRRWEDAVRAAPVTAGTRPLQQHALLQITVHSVDQNTPQSVGGGAFEDLATRQYGASLAAIKDDHVEITPTCSDAQLTVGLLKGLAYAMHHLEDKESGRRSRVNAWIAALNQAPASPNTDPLLNHVRARMAQVGKGILSL